MRSEARSSTSKARPGRHGPALRHLQRTQAHRIGARLVRAVHQIGVVLPQAFGIAALADLLVETGVGGPQHGQPLGRDLAEDAQASPLAGKGWRSAMLSGRDSAVARRRTSSLNRSRTGSQTHRL